MWCGSTRCSSGPTGLAGSCTRCARGPLSGVAVLGGWLSRAHAPRAWATHQWGGGEGGRAGFAGPFQERLFCASPRATLGHPAEYKPPDTVAVSPRPAAESLTRSLSPLASRPHSSLPFCPFLSRSALCSEAPHCFAVPQLAACSRVTHALAGLLSLFLAADPCCVHTTRAVEQGAH